MAPKDDDNGYRLLCPKFNGVKGPAFTAWAREFMDATEAKGDEDGSWADCYQGLDPQAGLTAAQVRRRHLVLRRQRLLPTVSVLLRLARSRPSGYPNAFE